MQNQGRQRVSRGNSSNGVIIYGTIMLIVGAGIAFGLATVWQANQKPLPPQNLVLSSSSEEPSSSSESASSSSSNASSISEGSSSEQSSTPTVAPGSVVPATDRVRSEYFDDALFVGDSITTGIKLYDVMSNTTVIASTGINLENVMSKKAIEEDGGDYTILEAMNKHKPTKIYIMLGANGVAFLSPTKTGELYGTFIDAVKAQHPNAIIYVQTILPINEAEFKLKYQGDVTNAKIDETNAIIASIVQQKGVYFVNVAEAFKGSDGGMPADDTPDGLHFGSDQYTKWFDYLKTHTVTK